MPTYLCHGFRWQRRSIRVYVVVQNLDDASPEWIIPVKSAQCILESFYNLFDFLPYRVPPPSRGSTFARRHQLSLNDNNNNNSSNGRRSQSQNRSRSRSQSRGRQHRDQTPPPPLPNTRSSPTGGRNGRNGTAGAGGHFPDEISAQDWSIVKVLEEYDPLNLDEVSRPYAYVADYVVRVDLSAGIAEEMKRYEDRQQQLQQQTSTNDNEAAPMTGATSDETGQRLAGKKPSRKAGGGWLEKLRDQLQRGEDICWYVVVNGDEARDWPSDVYGAGGEGDEEGESPLRPTTTWEQRQHHQQYMHQQLIFERSERERAREAGGAGDGSGLGGPRARGGGERRPSLVQLQMQQERDRDVPVGLRGKMGVMGSGDGSLSPKGGSSKGGGSGGGGSGGGGGLRRFFSRSGSSKAGDGQLSPTT